MVHSLANGARRTGLVIFSLLLSSMIGGAATAAEIEEMVVTATKRATTTHEVPISIEAFSGKFLEDYDITNLTELSSRVPNMSVGFGIATEAITIRGLGSGPERSFEQAVGLFNDGIYMPRSRQYQDPFFDVERIEVMRGPQSVILGLNSTAGAISIVNRKNRPGDATTLDFSIDYELVYGGPSMTAIVGGSPSENTGLRMAFKHFDRDGFYENTTTGETEGSNDDNLLRLSGVWTPTDKMTITARYGYENVNISGNVGEIYGGIAGILEPTDGVLNWKRSSDAALINPTGFFAENNPGTVITSQNAMIEAEYALPKDHTLTVLGGWSDFDYDLTTDLDTTGLSVLAASIDETYEQYSVEARIASDTEQTLSYMVGLYYLDSSNSQVQPNLLENAALIGAFGSPFVGGGSDYDLDTSLWSLFVHGTYNVTDRLRIIGGVRYVDEEKNLARDGFCFSIDAGPPPVFNPIPGLPGVCQDPALNGITRSRDSDNWMPEGVVQFDVNDNIMTYFKVGKSAKAGGFSAATGASPAQLEYGDETVLGYEGGIKARLLDGAAELNLTGFRSEFDDLQVNSFVVVSGPPLVVQPNIQNAAEAISQGIEIDGRWAVNDWLTVGGSFAYLDAYYESFETGPCTVAQTQAAAPDDCVQSLSGRPLPLAPEWSMNLSADVKYPVGGLVLGAGLNLSTSGDYYTDAALDPVGLQPSWQRLAARISVAPPDGSWNVSIIGTNLTDEVVLNTTQPFGDWYLGYIDPPRMVTLQAGFTFGGN